MLPETEKLENQQLKWQTTGAQAGAGKAHDSRHGVPLAKVYDSESAERKKTPGAVNRRQTVDVFPLTGFFISPHPEPEILR